MRRTTQHRGIQRAYMAILGGCGSRRRTRRSVRSHARRSLVRGGQGRPGQHGGASHHGHPAGRSGSAGQPRHLDRDAPDQLRVPLVSLPGRRRGRRVGLHADLERERQHVRRAPGRFRLPASRPGRRPKRRRAGHGHLESDGRDHLGRPDEHAGSPRSRARPPSATPSRPIAVSGRASSPSRTRSPGSAAAPRATTAARSRVRTTRTYEVRDADSGRTLRVRVTARNDRGQNSALSNPTGVVGGGQPASATRQLDPGRRPESGRRSPRHRVGELQPEPGDEPHGADHRAREDHRQGWPGGQRRPGVHASDAESRRRTDADDAVLTAS